MKFYFEANVDISQGYVTGRGVGTNRFAVLIGDCWVILFDYFFSLIYLLRPLS